MSSTRDRFKDAIWYPKYNYGIIIGGAGGISSWLSLFVARAGFYPTIYDFDIYEEHNMSGQFVKRKDIGKLKVDALFDNIKDFTDTECETFSDKYTEKSMATRIMLAGFDNMVARKDFFNNWKKIVEKTPNGEKNRCLFIDGRLTMEQIQIFSMKGDDKDAIRKYQDEWLFSDEEASETVCTLKQTSHIAAMIGTLMTTILTNHIGNIQMGKNYSKIPFKYEFFAPILRTDITYMEKL